ncbi:MAG: sigma 54-interacting transcriptional regulator [Deferrisomatales bacterium]
MEIEAFRFSGGGPKGFFEPVTVRAGSAVELAALRRTAEPRVYVVPEGAIDKLAAFDEVAADCGSKLSTKELFRHVVKPRWIGGRIPLLRAPYGAPEALKKSVDAILPKATAERNVFVLGVGDELFAALRGEAARRVKPIAAAAGDHGPSSRPGPAPSVAELLAPVTPPAGYQSAYLGRSAEAGFVRELILRAGAVDEPVLVLGDSGTGKEVVAQDIHRCSARRRKPYVPINCGAIPETLFESELFGVLPGVASGVVPREGLWRGADGGTLFLDEIGDLSLPRQVKVLRALQEQRIRPVGSHREVPVDARVVAATNRDLYAMVQDGHFREDLYYRLRGLVIYTWPLAAHPADIALLANHLWRGISKTAEELPAGLVRELEGRPWPGNVRELKMVLTQLHALCGARGLSAVHLRAVFEYHGRGARPASRPAGPEAGARGTVEVVRHLRRVLEAVQAAERAVSPVLREGVCDPDTAGVAAAALRHRLDELDILCLYPRRFGSQAVFDRVNGLRSKLLFFQDLLRDEPGAAAAHWSDHGGEVFDETLAAVLAEAEAALGAL